MWYMLNKYSKVYFNIVEKRKHFSYCGYTESHHIVPKSIGGSDDACNIVHLSAREHFICHLLLAKMTEGKNKYFMIHAINMMRGNRQNVYVSKNSKIYDMIKRLLSESRKNKPLSEETKQKISESHKGKKLSKSHKENISKGGTGLKRSQSTIEKIRLSHTGSKRSDTSRKKMSDAHKGKKLSEETKRKMSNSHKGKKHSDNSIQKMIQSKKESGYSHSTETREKLSFKALNRETDKCIHCGIVATKANLSRWHNDNCRKNPTIVNI